MEKKKLLLVAVSVGVVLLIILIIPLIIISPRKDFGTSWQEQSAVIEPPNLTQGWESAVEQEPVEIKPSIARASEIPAPPPRAVEQNIPASSIPVPLPRAVERPNVPAPSVPASPPKAVEQSNVTTLSIPAPRSVAVPDAVVNPAQPAKARPQTQPVVAEAPKEVKQQTAVKPAASAPAAKPAAEKPAVAEKPRPARTYDNSNFWIQTGAFSTMKHAEGAKTYLAERGITSIIEDPVINGKTWYRVRVGPYTTRDEANYWLALVKSIDGFSASQVWETAAR